jgi:methyl-accepting chemotaxis protein
LLTGNKEAAYLQFQQKANPALLEAEKIIKELAQYNAETAEKLDLENTNSAHNADRTILCIIIGAMVSSIGVGVFISRLITQPLKEVQRLMGIAETGDLTAVGSYYSKDEIGMLIKSYNQMLRGFRSVIVQIHETAHVLAANSEELVASEEQARTASNQITNHMHAVSIGAAQQLEQLQQVTIATEEMVSGIQNIAVNTQNVEQASRHTKSQTEEGRAFVFTSVQQMKQISEAVKVSAEFIQYMHKSSQDIEKIVTAITDISGQTNLLALNASIEAARAGENGRGFAVVADEVRKLAEQTAASAQQIKQLIQQIQSQSSHCVESMSLVTEEVESGVGGMSKIDNAFEGIMQAVARMFAEVQAVASISQQLAVGSEQVAASAVQIADVSREATHSIQTVSIVSQSQEASMEDISQAAKSLANLAEDMQQTVGRFKF